MYFLAKSNIRSRLESSAVNSSGGTEAEISGVAGINRGDPLSAALWSVWSTSDHIISGVRD